MGAGAAAHNGDMHEARSPPLTDAEAASLDWNALAQATEPPPITDDTVIEFLTDVEGNWEYVVHFVSMSQVLYWYGPHQGVWGPGKLMVKRNGMLVFGGDAPDKGPGDIRFVKVLVQLKREFPSQVFIVLGNRDTIKLRFLAEMFDGEEMTPWMPTWDPKATPYQTFLHDKKLARGHVAKCHWLLHCTMGCQDTTFATRQEELAILYGAQNATDELVVKSYVDSVDPRSSDPWMLELVRVGQMGVVLGNTLFVHGGVQDDSIGHVPGRTEKFENVHEWISALNVWKNQMLKEYEADPYWKGEGEQRKRNGEALIEYGTPGFGKKTVIYYNPFVDGNPVQRSEHVQQFLEESGIKRVLSGHQPHGQAPTVVRHPKTGLLVVTADTSRSDANGVKVFNPANNRGNVVAVVWIKGNVTYMKGVDAVGQEIRFALNVDPSKDALPDALVGRQLVDGSWVKAVRGPEHHVKVITARGRGFSVSVTEMNQMKACLSLSNEYGHGDPTFRVKISDIRAEFLSHQKLGLEDAPDPDDRLEPPPLCRPIPIDRNAFDSFATYLFSFNGVVKAVDADQIVKIVENINALIERKKRVVFVTNDSTMSRAAFFRRMTEEFKVNLDASVIDTSMRMGHAESELTSPELKEKMQQGMCITSAFTAAWYLKQVGLQRPFVIGSGTGLAEELTLAGITEFYSTNNEDGSRKAEFLGEANEKNITALCEQIGDIDSVVIGWDHQLSALTIAVAAQYITWREEMHQADKSIGRIPIIACSMDESGIVGKIPMTFPIEGLRGRKVRNVGIGTMARAVIDSARVENCCPIDVGKPSLVLQEHLRRPAKEGGCGIDVSEAVYIGDGLTTDIQMANQSGMKSLLVLSGVTSKERLLRETDGMLLPTWTAPSFAEI